MGQNGVKYSQAKGVLRSAFSSPQHADYGVAGVTIIASATAQIHPYLMKSRQDTTWTLKHTKKFRLICNTTVPIALVFLVHSGVSRGEVMVRF